MRKDRHERRRQRKRRALRDLLLLFCLLLSLLGLYVLVKHQEDLAQAVLEHQIEQHSGNFQLGDQVVLADKLDKKFTKKEELIQANNKVGQIVKINSSQDKDGLTYDVVFAKDLVLKGLVASQLKDTQTTYHLGDSIQLHSFGAITSPGEIIAISLSTSLGEDKLVYEAVFEKEGLIYDIGEEEIVQRYELALKASNTGSENNAILREAMAAAAKEPYTIIDFPKGTFTIGSYEPETDYLILASNVELVGHETTLEVDGTAFWFGLATGPTAIDGLSNFTMTGLDIRAKDLVKGNHFMLMANHGNDWIIRDNRFTMVHQSRSHIFDLGGVQNAYFSGNQFIGFAPDLTDTTSLDKETELHPYYSEVIQLDYSDSRAEWDAGMIKALDPEYDSHNAQKHLSNNIVIDQNQFLPYKDKSGQIMAYAGSIGQHSSDVAYAVITNNLFEDVLVERLKVGQDNWVLSAIHLPPINNAYVAGNVIR